MAVRRVVIMGAAGRDFHNFNMVFRDDPDHEVVAFTATQIPGIECRAYPPVLSGPLYPEGIPVFPEDNLESLIKEENIDEVVFAYSDVSHEYVMHQASRVLAAGADFCLLGPDRTMVKATVPVISVCAVRTGAGKSQTSRFLANLLVARGLKPVVIRHPMPYGDLALQRVQRFATVEDLEREQTTIEEREEYEAHIEQGLVVYAGVDYQAIVDAAQAEADIIIWDGGNNDFPFIRPDLEVVVADPFRVGHELSYHPGELNLRRADVIVINKVNSADPADVERLRQTALATNPGAAIVLASSVITCDNAEAVRGRRVLVVEDGPTLTHGGMPTGAGAEAARRMNADLVDPRPYAVGDLRAVYEKYPHLGPILPAVGYFPEQLRALEATIEAVPAELVVVATPVDLTRVLSVNKQIVRVEYELEERGEPSLTSLLNAFLARE